MRLKNTIPAILASITISTSAIAVAATPDAGSGETVRAVAPVFSRNVAFSMPKGFRGAFEQTSKDGSQYILEAVPAGESVQKWTQMITVTGLKGGAKLATPRDMALSIASRFKKACPESFKGGSFGSQISIRDDAKGFAVVASCLASGITPAEAALVVAIASGDDLFTVQWAVRDDPAPFADPTVWERRITTLAPRVCERVKGEAAPFKSCID